MALTRNLSSISRTIACNRYCPRAAEDRAPCNAYRQLPRRHRPQACRFCRSLGGIDAWSGQHGVSKGHE